MSASVTVPGPSSNGTPAGSISLSFIGTANLTVAKQISDALAAASGGGTLYSTTYSGGAVPTVTPGDTTEELVLGAGVTGAITVPAAASGVAEILVIPTDVTGPVTIYGNPGLQITGGNGNITVIDPAVVDFGGNSTTNAPNAVTLTSADSPYTVVAGPGAVETVYGIGPGLSTSYIYGGVSGDLINLTGATGNYVVTSEAALGDTVFAGSGNVTIDNLSASHDAIDQGAFGALTVDDAGTGDSISTGFGTAVVTAAGIDGQISGFGEITVNAAGGTGDTVAFGIGGTFYSSASSSGSMVFSDFGNVSVNASNTTSDTIIGDTGSLTVNAGNAASLLVFSGPSVGDPGLVFIGGSGFSTVVGQTGADSVTGGSGQLDFIANVGESVTGTGALQGSTLFGASGSYLDFAGSAGNLEFLGNAGSETLNASGSTGFNQFYAGSVGADSLTGESIVGGSNINSYVAGTGADTFTETGGTNVYSFVGSILGSSASHDVLTNFLTGTNDLVFISGTDTATFTGGTNTVLSLTDGTTIEFVGLTSSQVQSHIIT